MLAIRIMTAPTANAFASMRVQKLTSFNDIQAADDEHNRQLARPAPNVDAERTKDNRDFLGDEWRKPNGEKKSYVDRVKEKIGKQTIRKNAVLGLEVVMTYSPEMEPFINKDQFANLCYSWLEKEFPGCLVSLHEHNDETTGHCQALLVPLCGKTKEGMPKLNCNGLIGDRGSRKHDVKGQLEKLQDSFAETMAPLGLVRGIRHSDAKHISLKDLRKEDTRAAEKAQAALKLLTDEIPLPEFTPQFKHETDQEHQSRIKKLMDEHLDKVRKNVNGARDTLLKLVQGSLRHAAAQKRVEALEAQIEKKELEQEELKKQLEEAKEEIARLTGTSDDNTGREGSVPTAAPQLEILKTPTPTKPGMDMAA